MKNITEHKVNAANPRLSDEDPDPMEQDDRSDDSSDTNEGYLPWDADDLLDIRSIIEDDLSLKEREVIEAALLGQNHHDLGVSEKYFRYWYSKAIRNIRDKVGI